MFVKLFIIFFLGSLFGSFFYTLSVRYIYGSFQRSKFNALFSASRCPACGNNINPLYLIPVLGYIIAGGKCSKCSTRIPKVYPLMEILYGALALILYIKLGQNLYAGIIFFIIGLSVAISIIDIKCQKIPNSFVISFLVFSVYPVILNNSLKDNLFGFILMSVFFVTVLLIFPGSFGGGDVKFASSIGILLGLELSIVALETALVAGSLIGVIYAVGSKRGFKIKVPFAPFLTTGLLVSLLYGRDIIFIYYRLIY